MNKLILVIFFALTLSTANAGFNDWLNNVTEKIADGAKKVENVTNKISEYAGAAEKTLAVAANIVAEITKDLKTVSADVKALASDIEKEFKSLYNDALKIIETTKKFAQLGYTDGKTLYNDLKKQLDTIIAAAKADVERAVSSAKNTVSQLSADVKVVYRDGRLVVEQIKDAADLNQAVADVKAKNKEALAKTIETINAALKDANAIIKTAQTYLDNYKDIVAQNTANAKTAATKLVAEMKTFIAAAEKQLKEFKDKQEKTLKSIITDAEALYKSSKTILERATETLEKANDAYKKQSENVKGGINEVKDIWKEENLSGQKATGDFKQITEALDTIKNEAAKITDESKKVVSVVSGAEDALTKTAAEVSATISSIEFVVTANNLNIRSGPGTKNSVVGTLVKGDKVTILGQSGLWSRIGTDKWISSTYIKAADTQKAKESVETTKKTLTSVFESLKDLLNLVK